MTRLGALVTLVPSLAAVLLGAPPASSYDGVPAGVAATPTAYSSAYRSSAARRPAVKEVRVIGHSVKGRRIYAFRLGERGKGIPTVLVMSTIHGNERAIRQIPQALRDGRPIHGVDLWVIPTANPDGYARNTRKNAHGVDLNRNFPADWVHLTGHYASGPKPASEPETRALMRFLRTVRPSRIVSFHQPLKAVDTAHKNKRFSRRLARALHLPLHTVTCGGGCHGTMTSWYNRRFRGTAVTVEYGAHPTRHRMRVEAPRQLLRLFGGHR